MTSPANLTREQTIDQVIRELEGPTPLEVVVDRVLERKPSRAKNPRTPVRGDIRMYADRFGIVFADLERTIVVPASVAMRGVRFRHPVTDDEISRRTIVLDESEAVYLPGGYLPTVFNRSDLQLIDEESQVIGGEWQSIAMRARWDFGPEMIQLSGYKMSGFFHRHQVRAGDSLLFTIEQFNPPRWRIEHEPQAQRDQATIDRRNRELMDTLYQMLEEAQMEFLSREATAVRNALIQMADPYGYPGDAWLEAMEADGRMMADYRGITYADAERESIFDPFLEEFYVTDESTDQLEPAATIELPPLPEGAAARVYTFHAGIEFRSDLWRRFEVLGGTVLADLNSFLVEMFKHDDDHMGGFWKVSRRGKSKRTREVELATVDPLGGGRGSLLRVAELDLTEGDVIKWVFDFGQWYEHMLLLEAVTEPETPPAAEDYPRVVAANEPQLLYCRSCQAQGKQAVGVWCCWDCSEEQDEPVLFCEECSQRPEHMYHYMEEWVY